MKLQLTMMKVVLILVALLVGCIMALACLFAYNTYPMKAAEIFSFHVVTPIIHAGDDVIYQTVYSKYINSPGLTIKEAVAVSPTGRRYKLFSDVTNVPTGKNLTNVRGLDTPPHMETGYYYLDATWQWPLPGWREPQVLNLRADNQFYVIGMDMMKKYKSRTGGK